MLSPGMSCLVGPVRTDVSEKRVACIFKVIQSVNNVSRCKI
jgi:hypothetical protein